MSQSTIHRVEFKTNVVHINDVKQRDLARAKHLVAGHQPHGPNAKKHQQPKQGGDEIPVMNNGVTYLASCGFGEPATNCSLLIDTGSSNTWVKKEKYKVTSTSKDTRKPFSITYGLGSCSGSEYTDRLTLSQDLVIENQSIGVADKSDQMPNMDGILGVGPVALTKNTMAPDASNPNGIATVMDNLKGQDKIKIECIGIGYTPTTKLNAATGNLSFGGPDSTQCDGKLNYVPITSTYPASEYWGIDQSINYGNTEIMAKCAGISDTGTTLILLPQNVYELYQQKTGAKVDQTTGLLTVTQAQYEKMESLYFCVGGEKYEITPNAQIWPRKEDSTLNIPSGEIALVVASIGDIKAGDGLCFINGFSFLQRVYSVYDTTNARIGYAPTKYTHATTN
ncbi:acid protease [Roridomyces roridus]|uniref:Acid protease n=1 Tax=Roridomyces roridus TaxID=1738132 RepID=A0AAD7CB62_9AGAR|nr:acid protease [Roridomyces roridus]